MVLARTLGVQFKSSDISHGAALASGMNVNDINQVDARAKKLLQKAAKMPVRASAQDIINSAKLASFMRNQKDLIAQQLEQQKEQLDATLETREAMIKFATHKMNAEQKWQSQSQRLQEVQLNHRLATGVMQAESIGTQTAYAAAKRSRFSEI